MTIPGFFQSRHVVLREHPAEATIAEYAATNGWEHIYTHPGVETEEPRYLVWGIGPGLSFYYAEDKVAPISYIFVRSETPELSQAAIGALQRDFNPWTIEEMIEFFGAAKSPVEKGLGLMRLAIGGVRDQADRIVQCVEVTSRDKEAGLRGIAIRATHYLFWPEFRCVLTQVAKTDPERHLRKRAKEMIREYDRLGVPQP